MSEIKKKAQNMNPYVVARNLNEIAKQGRGNVYESLVVISERSKQIAIDLKKELQDKIETFVSSNEALEEISENKEQIEISKSYERLPNPVIIALEEFMNGEISYHYKNEEKEE